MNKTNLLIFIMLVCGFFVGANYMYVNYLEITKIGFFVFLGFTVIVMFCAVWRLFVMTAVITVQLPGMIDELLSVDKKD